MVVFFAQTLGAERKIRAKTLAGRNLLGCPRQCWRRTELQFYATAPISNNSIAAASVAPKEIGSNPSSLQIKFA